MKPVLRNNMRQDEETEHGFVCIKTHRVLVMQDKPVHQHAAYRLRKYIRLFSVPQAGR